MANPLSDLYNRHWKQSVIIVLATVVLMGLITLLLPNRYESEMKFLVNNERADLVISPDKNAATAAPSEVTESQVNSEMELLKSHDLLESIVRDRQLYPELNSGPAGSVSQAKLQRAVLKLERELRISAVRKSNIIEISYRDADPARAAALLQAFGDRYLTLHLTVHSAEGTNAFFTDEAVKARRDLESKQAALTAFHERTGLFSAQRQQSSTIDRYQAIDSQLQEVQAQIQEEKSRMDATARQLQGTPVRVVTQVREVTDQNALQQLEPMLAQLENRRIEMATKFKPTDRLVVELDKQIARTRNQLSRLRAEREPEQTTDVNPLHQYLVSELRKDRIEVQALQTTQAQLVQMRESYLKQLGEMDQSAVQLDSLEQDVKRAQDNYVLYTHRLDEARAAQALDRARFSNVALIEKPVVSPISVSPKRALNLAVGFLIGILFALGAAFWSESGAGTHQPAAPTAIRDIYPGRPVQAESGD